MFPKELPRSAVRKRVEKEKIKRGLKEVEGNEQAEETKASLSDMVVTFKRLFNNKVLMLMNTGAILHLFGLISQFLYDCFLLRLQFQLSPLLDLHAKAN